MYAATLTQPSYITLPPFTKNFEIKSGMVQCFQFFEDWQMRTRTSMLGSLRTFVKPWSITKW